MVASSQKTPIIRMDGGSLRIRFDNFGTDSYGLFLRVKRLPEYQVDYDRETCVYDVSAPARYAPMLGLPIPTPEASDLPMNPRLFDDQRAAATLALDTKRFAVWFDTGLGKSLILLEWLRQVSHRTSGRVLLITLANLISQMLEMNKEFYGDTLPIVRLNSKAEMREWCEHGKLRGEPVIACGQRVMIGIVNYEKFNPDGVGKDGSTIHELRHLTGLALDESSRLAMGGGKQKWSIIHSSKGIPYKLSCTATPAPNATMEFASQASFLERMRSEGEIIWTYFTRDSKTHRWTVKAHARKAFFEFMASWSIYVRDPRRFGWRLDMPDLPEPELITHEIAPTIEQQQEAAMLAVEPSGQMMLCGDHDTNTIQRAKLSQIAKGFVYNKIEPKKRKAVDPSGEESEVVEIPDDIPATVERVRRIPSDKPATIARIIKADVEAGLQVLVWTIFDAESDIIAEALESIGYTRHGKPAKSLGDVSFDVLTGKVKATKDGEIGPRDEMLERFRTGKSRILISRAVMLGYGMNFQHCGSMVFSGWSDSYIQWYQAIRRAYRYGQTKRVRIHVPVIRLLEGTQLENIGGKEDRNEAEIREMENNYLAAMRETGLIKLSQEIPNEAKDAEGVGSGRKSGDDGRILCDGEQPVDKEHCPRTPAIHVADDKGGSSPHNHSPAQSETKTFPCVGDCGTSMTREMDICSDCLNKAMEPEKQNDDSNPRIGGGSGVDVDPDIHADPRQPLADQPGIETVERTEKGGDGRVGLGQPERATRADTDPESGRDSGDDGTGGRVTVGAKADAFLGTAKPRRKKASVRTLQNWIETCPKKEDAKPVPVNPAYEADAFPGDTLTTDEQLAAARAHHAKAKDEYPGVILLYEVMGAYRVFDDHAKTVSGICGSGLAKMEREDGLHHGTTLIKEQLERQLRRLISAGHKVAICEGGRKYKLSPLAVTDKLDGQDSPQTPAASTPKSPDVKHLIDFGLTEASFLAGGFYDATNLFAQFRGGKVPELPAVVKHDGKLWIGIVASNTADYRMIPLLPDDGPFVKPDTHPFTGRLVKVDGAAFRLGRVSDSVFCDK